MIIDELKKIDWQHYYMKLEGRLGRKDYLVFSLLLAAVILVIILLSSFILGLAFSPNVGAGFSLLATITSLIYLLMAVVGLIGFTCLTVKRLHDFNQSGWWAIGVFVISALIPLIPFIVLCAIPGTKATNKFG